MVTNDERNYVFDTHITDATDQCLQLVGPELVDAYRAHHEGIIDSQGVTVKWGDNKIRITCEDSSGGANDQDRGDAGLLGIRLTCARCGKKEFEMMSCVLCKATHYCSRDCQTASWKQHKQTCVPVLPFKNSWKPQQFSSEEERLEAVGRDVTGSELSPEDQAALLRLGPMPDIVVAAFVFTRNAWSAFGPNGKNFLMGQKWFRKNYARQAKILFPECANFPCSE